MTALVWDKPGERSFQTGVDRGVLYLLDQNETTAVWNGLTSVEETPNSELKSYYLNGLKYLEYISPGDFSGILKAYTYPDEFDAVNGIVSPSPGLNFHDQPPKTFGLSYRTKIGNDQDVDAGYLIHILYNVIVDPSSSEHASIGEQIEPTEFSWNLSAKPVTTSGSTWRPTAHITIDSRDTPSEVLQDIEDELYGTEASNPHLLTFDELIALFIPAP